jgi:hypothetical protein
MTCVCELREQRSFNDWADFEGHARRLQVDANWREVPVLQPQSNVGFIERWYRCVVCGRSWRLVEPDPPFRGVWEEV